MAAKGWKESTFTTAFLKSFNEHGGIFVHKISDMPHFQGMRTRFDAKKPFDVFLIYDGVPVAIEIKTNKGNFPALPMSRLADHQQEALTSFANAGGKSYVVLNVFRSPSAGVPRINGYMFWEWHELEGRTESIKKAELLEKEFYEGTGANGYCVHDLLANIKT
jgi:penicillin-binding protein-related factor A (putative recombinase)